MRSLVVDEERMMPGHWLGLVVYISFSYMTLMVGWQEERSASKKPSSQRFCSGTDGGGGLRSNWLTQDHLVDGC